MRVGTLFEPETAAFLDRHFVLVRHNQLPQLYCGDGIDVSKKYSPEQLATAVDGSGGGNVRSYFCTADGRVINYVAGRWSPEKFLREARWALKHKDRGLADLSKAHDKLGTSYQRSRDREIPPAEMEWATNAAVADHDNATRQRAAVIRRHAMAYNRMIRSHREAHTILLRDVMEVLRKVEQEIYTKGALG
jgi:hypothetical protein